MFDVKKFQKTKFKAREEAVPVPGMKDFFDKDEPAVWVIKGLSGQEIGRAKEAASKNKNIAAIVEALTGNQKDKVQGIKEALGIGTVPDNIAERIAMLEAGSVKPKCDTELALKVCEHFPVDFYNLTTNILTLTGKGSEPGKPKGSTQTPESEPA